MEEGSLRNDDAFSRLPQLEVNVIRLATTNILGALACEDEISTKLALAHFGIDFANRKGELGALSVEGGAKSRTDAVDVVLVDHRFNLVVGKVVHLANHLSGGDVLSQDDVKKTQLAVDLRADVEILFPLVDELDVAAHICKAELHLFHLDAARD